MFRFLLFASLVWVCHGLQWVDNLPDHSRVDACEGGDIVLLFNYTLSHGERHEDTKWIFQSHGRADEMVAMLSYNHFVVMPAFSGRVQWMGEGGITISGAAPLESGNYSIEVSALDHANTMNRFQKTANVQVVEIPKASGGRLHVQQSAKGVYDNSTKEWKVQLTCGVLFDRGQPSLDVEWTTPDGHNLQSSSSDNNGTFYLLLDNPPTGGNYTCTLPPSAPATSCLPSQSPLREGASVVVSEVKAAFSLLEAKQTQIETEMKAENNQLKAEIAQQKAESERQKAEVAQLVNETNQQNAKIQQLQLKLDVVSRRVAFHAKLTSDLDSYAGRLQPFTILLNEGNAFNPADGIFTSPFNGTYLMIGTSGNGGYNSYLELQKEGTRISYNIVDGRGYNDAATVHATVHLAVGERVWLQSASSSSSSYYYSPTTYFSGFLISADN